MFCESTSAITFIGPVYFNESYESAIECSDSCNITFIGNMFFYRNSASIGGAICSYDSNIMFSGTICFEGNKANYSGGALALLGASKLIFKPNLNAIFILNDAHLNGGALYVRDYQCSLGSAVPIECFIIIDSHSVSTNNISLHFENNSAGVTGSILYGGQLDRCRLYFMSNITTKQPDILCGYQVHGYSDDALKTFINMSNIAQNEYQTLNNVISSPAKKIEFCEGEVPETVLVYPGQQFTIPLIALG